jgi:hypothetical protein
MRNGSTLFSISPFDVVIWTCVAVFVIAAVSACLNIFGGLPTIPLVYRDKVFYALILEIVGVGVTSFARYMRAPANAPNRRERAERAPPPIGFSQAAIYDEVLGFHRGGDTPCPIGLFVLVGHIRTQAAA